MRVLDVIRIVAARREGRLLPLLGCLGRTDFLSDWLISLTAIPELLLVVFLSMFFSRRAGTAASGGGDRHASGKNKNDELIAYETLLTATSWYSFNESCRFIR